MIAYMHANQRSKQTQVTVLYDTQGIRSQEVVDTRKLDLEQVKVRSMET